VYVCVCVFVCVLFVCTWGYQLLYTEQALPHLCVSVFVCMCVCARFECVYMGDWLCKCVIKALTVSYGKRQWSDLIVSNHGY
jgi:hypothetical protein